MSANDAPMMIIANGDVIFPMLVAVSITNAGNLTSNRNTNTANSEARLPGFRRIAFQLARDFFEPFAIRKTPKD